MLGNDGQKLTGRLFLDQGNAADHSKEFPRGRLDVHFSQLLAIINCHKDEGVSPALDPENSFQSLNV